MNNGGAFVGFIDLRVGMSIWPKPFKFNVHKDYIMFLGYTYVKHLSWQQGPEIYRRIIFSITTKTNWYQLILSRINKDILSSRNEISKFLRKPLNQLHIHI